MKKNIRLFSYITCIISAASLLSAVSCGHSSSNSETYAETISWEEVMDEEYSDSAAQAAVETYDSVDSGSNNPKSDSVGSDSANTSPEVPLMAPGKEVLPVNSPDEPQKQEVQKYTGKPFRVRRIGNLAEIFNDSNYVQLQHAERLGITPISDLRSYYRNRRPLVKIASNKDYKVDKLTHSFPYLVPEADRLLHDIGRAFSDSLRSRGGGAYKVIVTSVMRTPSTVKRLKRVNRNAVEMSTHQYATTFDITYNRFSTTDEKTIVASEEMKILLAEILHNLRAEGRCLVKYERKSPCFHITVTR